MKKICEHCGGEYVADRYCGGPLEECGSGLDRKNNDEYYSIETCVPCCGRCNTTFMDLYSYEEKMILAEAIRRIELNRNKEVECQF